MARQAIVRCDGSPTMGAGHLARCLTLADALAERGWRCRFLTNAEAEAVLPRLGHSAHTVHRLDERERCSVAPVLAAGGDLLVVDHYDLDAEFERSCRDAFAVVLAIDDPPLRPHHCDILLNQNVVQSHDAGAATTLLSGSTYALLAPAFARRRNDALRRRGCTSAVRRILVCFGSSDPADMCGRVTEALLEDGPDAFIDIAVSAASPHTERLRALQQRARAQVQVHFDSDDMAGLMAAADLSIGAGGTTTWERCCLGLPTLVYICADNQADIARAVDAAGAAILLGRSDGFDPRDLAQAVAGLADLDRRWAMSERAASLCDGGGAGRVVDAIEAAFCQAGPPGILVH